MGDEADQVEGRRHKRPEDSDKELGHRLYVGSLASRASTRNRLRNRAAVSRGKGAAAYADASNGIRAAQAAIRFKEKGTLKICTSFGIKHRYGRAK